MITDYCIILVSDTHVGDRVNQLDSGLLAAIRVESPNEIWHAGDVCTPSAIDALNQIAPTIAVEGNRDWFLHYHLPREITRDIHGIRFVLTHGHISIKEWALNYLRLFTSGHQVSHVRFQEALAKIYPDANVVVYGHLHLQLDEVMDGQRFINPGAGYPERRNKFRLCYARLDISPTGHLTVNLKSVAAESA
ncbi:MAG: metallophosphoesterase family protein [Anaerolineaceae bacterium]